MNAGDDDETLAPTLARYVPSEWYDLHVGALGRQIELLGRDLWMSLGSVEMGLCSERRLADAAVAAGLRVPPGSCYFQITRGRNYSACQADNYADD
jgi:hypothetical protein